MEGLRMLGPGSLRALAAELGHRTALLPIDRGMVAARVPSGQTENVRRELEVLVEGGWTGPHLALLLNEMATGRERELAVADRCELVLSPPNLDGVDARDTSAVIAGLFRQAKRRLLIVTYALDGPEACRTLFGELAERMDKGDGVEVDLVVDIRRPRSKDGLLSDADDVEIVRKFISRLRRKLWPGEKLPQVFFDVRALSTDMKKRASMHAKVVVADGEVAFITSANFTEAANTRNIEAGILVRDKRLAERLERQFRQLRQQKTLMPARG